MTPVDAKASSLTFCPMTSSSSRAQSTQPQQLQLNQQQFLQHQSAALVSVPNGIRHLTSLTISVPPTPTSTSRPLATSCHNLSAAPSHRIPPHLDSPTLLAPASPRCDAVAPPPILQLPSALPGKPSDEHNLAMQQRQMHSLLQQQQQGTGSRSRSNAESGLLLQYRGTPSGDAHSLPPPNGGALALPPMSGSFIPVSSSPEDSPGLTDPPTSKSAKQRLPQQQHPAAAIPPLMAPPPARPHTATNFAHPALAKLHKPPPLAERTSQVVVLSFSNLELPTNSKSTSTLS